MKSFKSLYVLVVALVVMSLTGCDDGKAQKVLSAEEKFKDATRQYQVALIESADKKIQMEIELQKKMKKDLEDYQKSFTTLNEALKPGPTVRERSKEMLIGARDGLNEMKSSVINKYDELTH